MLPLGLEQAHARAIPATHYWVTVLAAHRSTIVSPQTADVAKHATTTARDYRIARVAKTTHSTPTRHHAVLSTTVNLTTVDAASSVYTTALVWRTANATLDMQHLVPHAVSSTIARRTTVAAKQRAPTPAQALVSARVLAATP